MVAGGCAEGEPRLRGIFWPRMTMSNLQPQLPTPVTFYKMGEDLYEPLGNGPKW